MLCRHTRNHLDLGVPLCRGIKQGSGGWTARGGEGPGGGASRSVRRGAEAPPATANSARGSARGGFTDVRPPGSHQSRSPPSLSAGPAIKIHHDTPHYLVISKPPGISSQQNSTKFRNAKETVLYQLSKLIRSRSPSRVDPQPNGPIPPERHPTDAAYADLKTVHRLDRGVLGLMVVAKTGDAARRFSKGLRLGGNSGWGITRRYIGLVELLSLAGLHLEHIEWTGEGQGVIRKDNEETKFVLLGSSLGLSSRPPLGEVSGRTAGGVPEGPSCAPAYAGKGPVMPEESAALPTVGSGSSAASPTGAAEIPGGMEVFGPPRYPLSKPGYPVAILFELGTGRKHQIRRHMAEILRSPIIGDSRYGCNGPEFPLRQIALHSIWLRTRVGVGGIEVVDLPTGRVWSEWMRGVKNDALELKVREAFGNGAPSRR